MIRTGTLDRRSLPASAFLAGVLAMLFVPGSPLTPVPGVHAAVGPGPKIYIFPYQPVFKGVPKEIIDQTTELLKNEIKHSDEVRLQKGPIFIPEATPTTARPLSDKELKQARKLQQDGEKFYLALDFQKAAKSFKAALGRYERSLALLGDYGPVVDCQLMLSVCYYRTDQEEQGAKMLVKVIRLKPDLLLDPDKYPPMFRNTAEAIRKKLLLKSRGELEVVANIEGATVFFNGSKVGVTPILLKELVPGEHFIRVEMEGLQPWGDKVSVISTQRRRVLAALGGVKKATGPLGEIAEALRANGIDANARKKAQAEGKKIKADFVVLGGVALIGGNYKVGSFLLKVADAKVCPLPAIQFDPDLLGASVEVYNMASILYKRVEGCPDPLDAKMIALVQTAVKKSTVRSVSIGPAVPAAKSPAETKPAAVAVKTGPTPPTKGPATPTKHAKPAPSGPASPAKEPTPPAKGPAKPTRGPATPAKPGDKVASASTGPRKPTEPAKVTTTSEGLATTGPSSLDRPVSPVVAPIIPVANRVRPIDEVENRGPGWYQSWWFWTLVGAAVVGGTVGGLYAGGVFDADASGASVTVRWNPR